MFSLLESKKEIASAQRKLEASIRKDFRTKDVRDIGYPGGTIFKVKVVTDGTYWYWSADTESGDTPSPRRLNFLGLYTEKGGLQISVEVNTTHEGRNDRVAGFFARNSTTGAIYLVHSGRVGGGTKGVGKNAFLAWTNQRPINVVDSTGGIRQGVIVMPVEGKQATASARRYVDSIAAFKQAVRDDDIDAQELEKKQTVFRSVYPEPRGRRVGYRSGEFDYLSRHGDVVDALAEWRTSSGLSAKGRVVKNVLLDMGVEVSRKLTEVYEVKTSAGRSDVYTAIGQLMVHGDTDNCKRVMVLPHDERLAPDLKAALQRWDIQLLRFKLTDTSATIVAGLARSDAARELRIKSQQSQDGADSPTLL